MRAHAPGSVTTMFRPAEDGSYGVSLATADGVTATVREAADPALRLDDDPVEMAPVEIALGELGVSPEVRLRAELPIGCGFGISGAATLATVLAADAEFDLGHEREELVGIAHRAEVEAGTGLGDVFVQERGGLVWNVGDGIESQEFPAEIQYATFGGLATAALLNDEAAIERVRKAADTQLDRFDPGAGFDQLLDVSWEFARATGLPTDDVVDAVDRVKDRDGSATMAMIGETVVATGAGDALDGSTTVAAEGARLLS